MPGYENAPTGPAIAFWLLVLLFVVDFTFAVGHAVTCAWLAC